MNNTLKKRIINAYKYMNLADFLIFIFLPIAAVIIAVSVDIDSLWLYFLIILWILMYFVFIYHLFLPLILFMYDLKLNNFVMKKIFYRDSYVEDCRYFHTKYSDDYLKRKNIVFVQVVCILENGDFISLLCPLDSDIIIGQYYTITYGKYSKVIVSIQSENNGELLGLPNGYHLEIIYRLNPIYRLKSELKNTEKGKRK